MFTSPILGLCEIVWVLMGIRWGYTWEYYVKGLIEDHKTGYLFWIYNYWIYHILLGTIGIQFFSDNM